MTFNDALKRSFRTSLPDPPGTRVFNLPGSSLALMLAMMDEPFAMVEANDLAARALVRDIGFFFEVLGGDGRVFYVPQPEGPEYIGARAEAVLALSGGAEGAGGAGAPYRGIVTTPDALGHVFWDAGALNKMLLTLRPGTEIERDEAVRRLDALGYTRTPLVSEPGQYSLRGFVLDVFPAGGRVKGPVRAEFFGDQLEGLRLFDLDTQRSISEIEKISLYPLRLPQEGPGLWDLAAGMRPFVREAAGEDAGELEGLTRGAAVLSEYKIAGGGVDAGALPMAGLGFLPEERKSLEDFSSAIRRLGPECRVVIAASGAEQSLRLREILREGGVIAGEVALSDLGDYPGRVSVSVGRLSAGFHLPGLLVLTEREIFGGRPAYRSIKKSGLTGLMTKLEDLRAGDYVVHYDHGIGRFRGLERQHVEGEDFDLLAVDYAGGGTLYLPLHAIGKLKKHYAGEMSDARLDSLGSRIWHRTREKVRKKIKDMAGRLLKLHSERKRIRGTAFSADTEMHREFDGFFEYEETADQVKAIAEIKADMESPSPMDRLLAGDVGYGKTEVAMRAAFKAVYDGCQVAVLVPTTLLCEQHLRVFRKRFSAFPVTLDSLSRFKTAAEKKQSLKNLAAGRTDIIIATHSLLRKDIGFANLGLLIIDEEHRFGVGQKEKIKELKRGVDVLSLSATPIPRTLQMSLSGIRSMSTIETPPEERLGVISSVAHFEDSLVAEALRRELKRGGQVFFVHNRIMDIEKVAKRVKRLAPGAKLAVAHGRMTERALEAVMLKFLDGSVDVLVCTAIIGSGLDIPTANTIIIDMAERMGLADLYQLKGRVGRSERRAYAYFLMPQAPSLTEDARKRLQAIQELSYLGAGLRLAMKDLEIRGAGNLLGAEQSGYIDAVGLDIYIEMLEQAVTEARGEKVKPKSTASVDLGVRAQVPEGYVEDMGLRLSLYRAVASAGDAAALSGLKEEMADRFGPPPAEVLTLLRVMEARLMAEALGITAVTAFSGRVEFAFPPEAGFSPEDIIHALGGGIKFSAGGFSLPSGGDSLGTAMGALTALARPGGEQTL